MRRLVRVFPAPSYGFGWDYRHARAIHLDIQHGNFGAGQERQRELHRTLDFQLLAASNIGADLLGMALDRFAGYRKAFFFFVRICLRHLATWDYTCGCRPRRF